MISYFESYPLWVRDKVKIVSTDMYMPYIDTAKTIFKNTKIVVDKFNIVQLIKNNLNSIRVELIKRKTTSQRDYKILKRYWKLLLKKEWDLNSTKFNRFIRSKEFTCPYDIVRYILSLDEDMQSLLWQLFRGGF
ncbi:transposase [Peptostreptococcus anaerobius]|uniref:transposase n=1 Tax=Peptostreptococcus anaerobius TaxID=1261 RepID=UPI003D6E7A98